MSKLSLQSLPINIVLKTEIVLDHHKIFFLIFLDLETKTQHFPLEKKLYPRTPSHRNEFWFTGSGKTPFKVARVILKPLSPPRSVCMYIPCRRTDRHWYRTRASLKIRPYLFNDTDQLLRRIIIVKTMYYPVVVWNHVLQSTRSPNSI